MDVYLYAAFTAFLVFDILLIRWLIRRHRKANDPMSTRKDWPYKGHK